jgi:hypothetical protein
MEGSLIVICSGRLEKTVKKDLEVNDLDVDKFYDRALQHRLIYVAYPT